MPLIDETIGSGGTGGGGGGGISLTDVHDAFKVIQVTLTLADITNKYATLGIVPESAGKVTVSVIGGLDGEIGVDYTIDTGLSRINWNGLGWDGKLASGDVLQLQYFEQ
jgi:hypothetical protein